MPAKRQKWFDEVVGSVQQVRGMGVTRPFSESLLYDVRPMDPLVASLAALGLTTVAMLATTLPAWRASRVDPVIALRQE